MDLNKLNPFRKEGRQPDHDCQPRLAFEALGLSETQSGEKYSLITRVYQCPECQLIEATAGPPDERHSHPTSPENIKPKLPDEVQQGLDDPNATPGGLPRHEAEKIAQTKLEKGKMPFASEESEMESEPNPDVDPNEMLDQLAQSLESAINQINITATEEMIAKLIEVSEHILAPQHDHIPDVTDHRKKVDQVCERTIQALQHNAFAFRETSLWKRIGKLEQVQERCKEKVA